MKVRSKRRKSIKRRIRRKRSTRKTKRKRNRKIRKRRKDLLLLKNRGYPIKEGISHQISHQKGIIFLNP